MAKSTPSETATSIPFDSVSQRVFLQLWRTYDILKAIEGECLSRFELSAQQYNVLRILRANHPECVPTMQLGREMISRGPDVTRMLDRLNDRKLIKRTRLQQNRRVVAVGINASGLRLLDRMQAAILEMHERQLGHMKKKDKEQLIELLRAARRPHESTSDREGWLL